jgi:hypothetical protein
MMKVSVLYQASVSTGDWSKTKVRITEDTIYFDQGKKHHAEVPLKGATATVQFETGVVGQAKNPWLYVENGDQRFVLQAVAGFGGVSIMAARLQKVADQINAHSSGVMAEGW